MDEDRQQDLCCPLVPATFLIWLFMLVEFSVLDDASSPLLTQVFMPRCFFAPIPLFRFTFCSWIAALLADLTSLLILYNLLARSRSECCCSRCALSNICRRLALSRSFTLLFSALVFACSLAYNRLSLSVGLQVLHVP